MNPFSPDEQKEMIEGLLEDWEEMDEDDKILTLNSIRGILEE